MVMFDFYICLLFVNFHLTLTRGLSFVRNKLLVLLSNVDIEGKAQQV